MCGILDLKVGKLHRFVDILEPIVENKNESLDKTDWQIWSQKLSRTSSLDLESAKDFFLHFFFL